MDITIEKRIEHVCKTIYDPEIPQNIWDLGLVYSINAEEFNSSGYVEIVMTLTTPSCPVGPEFLNNVKTRVEEIKEIKKCKVDLVWDPPWDASMMSEEAQTMLGMELNRPMLDGTRAPSPNLDEGWE
jgi:metal-sulfur cluster biosynthetic enzyme